METCGNDHGMIVKGSKGGVARMRPAEGQIRPAAAEGLPMPTSAWVGLSAQPRKEGEIRDKIKKR